MTRVFRAQPSPIEFTQIKYHKIPLVKKKPQTQGTKRSVLRSMISKSMNEKVAVEPQASHCSIILKESRGLLFRQLKIRQRICRSIILSRASMERKTLRWSLPQRSCQIQYIQHCQVSGISCPFQFRLLKVCSWVVTSVHCCSGFRPERMARRDHTFHEKGHQKKR